jgi:nitrogen fixation/metabolism regulation signal transduction histidine kinase
MWLRVLLLAANCMLFAFGWYGSGDYFTLFNLGLLILVQTGLLIYFLNRTNRDLAYFFDSLKNEDPGLSSIRSKKPFQRLYRSLVSVQEHIASMRIKYAAQDQYFKTIIDNIRIGIVTFESDGRVGMMNKAARNMLGVHVLYRMDALDKLQEGLGKDFREMNPGDNRLVNLTAGREPAHLSVSCTILKTTGRDLRIFALHDIRQELDKKETESWQKLIRILNHEVMNSLAPIMSTAATIRDYLSAEKISSVSGTDQQHLQVFEKTIAGLSIIYERSDGLKRFVEHYKMLNTLPMPAPATFLIRELFETCVMLLDNEMRSGSITCYLEINVPGMELTADKSQIQQVLLNLLKNSIESLSETDISEKVIKLKASYTNAGKVLVQVTDNGKGIPPEIADQIFIPFFTTREKGSGIGLSLSRQIMHLHHGTLSAYSVPFRETTFTLCF